MKVLAVTPLYPPRSLVGAWMATHRFLAYLAANGHHVDAAAFLARSHGWEHEGVTVHTARTGRTAIRQLAARADIVVGHAGDNGYAADIATVAHRPLVQIFHGGPKMPDPLARLVVFNSAASAAACRWDGPSVVCRPYTDPAEHATTPGDRVTLVNCSLDKGAKTAWRCAERLPHRRFLGVLGGYGDQVKPRAATNADVISPTNDMRGDVWSRTRILLMPSRHEAWGMVGVEALASGIPVIAHPTAGLAESLGAAGVFVDRNDIDRWTGEIERLHDPAEYAAAQTAARARSDELAAHDQRPRFLEAITAVAGIPA